MGTPQQLNYYRLQEETTFATAPAGTWIGFSPDEFSLEVENELDDGNKLTGTLDRPFRDIVRQNLNGSLTTQIWPDNAAEILNRMIGIGTDAAGTGGRKADAGSNLVLGRSYTIDHYHNARNEYLRHLGVMCNQATLSCTSTDPKLKAALDLLGQSETTTPTFTRPTMPAQASFELSDMTLTIDSVSEPNITGFEIQINNNLDLGGFRNTSRQVRWIDSGVRDITLRFDVRINSDNAIDYRNIMRGRDTNTRFSATFNYPGTGSPIDSVVITIPDAIMRRVAKPTGSRDLSAYTIECEVKRPAAAEAMTILIT